MEKESERKLVFSFLRQHPLVTLSTLGSDGRAQNAAMYVYIEEDLTCYFVTRPSTRKFTNISERPHVTLSTHDENTLWFVELTGTATPLEDQSSLAVIVPELQKIVISRKAEYWTPPVGQIDGDEYVYLKMKPDKALCVNYVHTESPNTSPRVISFEI